MAQYDHRQPWNSPAGNGIAASYNFASPLSPAQQSAAPIPGGAAGGSNPFSAIIQALGQAVGSEAQQPVADTSSMGGTTAQQPSGMSVPTYNGLLDPSRGGIFGLIGRMSGMPTREEALQSKYAEAQRQGLIGLQKRLDDGMPQNQAVMDFINSPEGQRFWGSSNDPVGAIKGYIQAMQKTRNIQQSGSDYVDLTDPDHPKVLYKGREQPTTEEKDFEYFADKAGWTDEQKAAGAEAILKNKTRNKNLVPGTSKDDYGNNIPGLVDLDTMVFTPLTNIGTAPGAASAPANPAVQGTQPAAGVAPQSGVAPQPQIGQPAPVAAPAPAAALSEDEGRPSGDIILGTGPLSVTKSKVGPVFAALDPTAVDQVNEERQNAVNTIQFAAQQLRGSGTGSRAVSSDVKRLDSIIKGVGMTTDPIQLGQSYLSFWDYLDRQERSAKKRVAEPDLDASTKKDWSDRLAEVRSVRDMLPTRESIKDAMTAYRNNPSQFDQAVKGAPKAIQHLEDVGSKAVNDAAQAGGLKTMAPDIAAKSFASEAEVEAAFKAGKVKIGDTVTVNGQPMRVDE